MGYSHWILIALTIFHSEYLDSNFFNYNSSTSNFFFLYTDNNHLTLDSIWLKPMKATFNYHSQMKTICEVS
jgi:hypothetical protein